MSVSGEEWPAALQNYSENYQGQDRPVPGQPAAALAQPDTVLGDTWHSLPSPLFLRRSLNHHLFSGEHWDVLSLSLHFQWQVHRGEVSMSCTILSCMLEGRAG